MPTPIREVDVEVLPKTPPPPSQGGPGPVPVDPLTQLIARIMDSLFKVPGTNIKFGLDPVVGLIPGVGSGASSLISLLLVARSAMQGVPNHILFQMVGNVLVNAILDAIPAVGGALSIFYRSNNKNYELLKKHAGTRKKMRWQDWLLLGGMALAVVGLLLLLFIGMITVMKHTFHALKTL